MRGPGDELHLRALKDSPVTASAISPSTMSLVFEYS
jgi:hypothetical protein